MNQRKPKIQHLGLMDKAELALISLLDTHFGNTVNPHVEQAEVRAPSEDAPPPNVQDQLRLIKAVTDFIHLKHRIYPEDEDGALGSMVEQLRTATKRSARDAAAKNGVGTSALLHRADEHPADDDGEPDAA